MSRKNLIVREKKNDKGEIFREFSLRDEHSYMIGLNNGIEKGKLEAEKKVLNLFEKYDFIDKEIYEKEIGGMK